VAYYNESRHVTAAEHAWGSTVPLGKQNNNHAALLNTVTSDLDVVGDN